jgi:hypothetical protein
VEGAGGNPLRLGYLYSLLEVNVKNNDARLYSKDERTLAGLEKKWRELACHISRIPVA